MSVFDCQSDMIAMYHSWARVALPHNRGNCLTHSGPSLTSELFLEDDFDKTIILSPFLTLENGCICLHI